jgi:transcriptional regulator with XRE-family HTH domain
MSTNIVGKQISLLRKEKGIKQEELANYVGVSTQAVSKWENGGVPDIELLPKIADFFSVPIDFLFGRNMSDYGDLHSALIEKIGGAPHEQRFRQAFKYCWDIERALTGADCIGKSTGLEVYEEDLPENAQEYSYILTNYGFTRMGIANRLQYFLIVPEAKDTEVAYLNGIDYPSFFKDFSDRDFFNTCVFLSKRDHKKAFTPALLIKNLEITLEKANDILKMLSKYNLISSTQIEMDDEIQTVYNFRPNSSFIALLIFARELIDRPFRCSYTLHKRDKPYL